MRNFAKRLEVSPPILWFSLGFVLRLIFALKLGNGFYQIDESGFYKAALNLAHLNIYGSGKMASAGAPIPAFYYALFFRLFGDHPLYARLGLLIPDMVLVWIVWKMTEELTRSQIAGKIALAISSIYPFFIYYGAMMMSETPYLVLIGLGFWQFCKNLAEEGKNFMRSFIAGTSLALAGLSRPEGAVIMLGIWPLAFFFSRKNSRLLKSLALSCLCWTAILFSWSLRNRAQTGSFALDSHGGVNLLYGTMLFNVNEQDTSAAINSIDQIPSLAGIKKLPASLQDKIYWRTAFDFICEHPKAVIKQWGQKTINFWRFYPRQDKFYMEGPRSQPNVGLKRSGLVLISLLTEPFLIFLGSWGIFELLKINRAIYPIFLFILATFFLHMVSVSQMRYRLPVMPFLILGFSSFIARGTSVQRQLTHKPEFD